MFIAIVQIPMTKRPRDVAVDSARKSAPTYTALGAKPTVTYYDNHVMVDNEAGQVKVEE